MIGFDNVRNAARRLVGKVARTPVIRRVSSS